MANPVDQSTFPAPRQMAGVAPPPGFTHLHVHSHFSLLRGTASVQQLAARAAADGLTHLALTDTNALYGAVAFDRACRAAGVQPIIGMQATVAAPTATATTGPAGQLVLLATGATGYRSLCRLSSLLQSSPRRQALAEQGLDWDALKAHCAGLICLAAGRQGWVERLLRIGDAGAALQYAGRLAGIFGEHAFLAVEIHRPEDVSVAREVLRIGRRLGLPTLAVQPVYCLSHQDRPRLRLLAAIEHNCRLVDVPATALPDGDDLTIDLHWLAPAEVQRRFAGLAECVANVSLVSAQCEPALPDGRPIWPVLHLNGEHTPQTALAAAAHAGLQARYGPAPAPAIGQRLQHELAAIAEHGYAPLFLLVADIVRYAQEHDIPVSTRGSVANSLVAYCVGITTVDPIQHDLLFERFIHPARRNPPDIDLDFCSRRRDQVLAHVRATYGPERTALVSTVSTLRPKSAVRETAKAYGLDEAATEQLLKLTPSGWHPDPRRRSSQTLEQAAAQLTDVHLRQVLLDAAGLVGQPDHLSVHPGGLVVTPGPLTDVVPVQWTAKGFLVTQFDAEGVEAIGLPKLDLLGIRALTVLADSADLVRRFYDPAFRLAAIPPADPATGDRLAQGDTIGVFQCESTGAQRTLRQLRARNVEDLAVANAFFKPGPALGGMARAFVRRYRGEEDVGYLHPALEPILGRTKGVLIFQEQILRIAVEIAGLSWEQADHLRRGMSHFGREEMAAMQAVFVAGCMRPPPAGPGFTEQQARTLWEQVLPFAGYGFNQGHATAYADVSYRSAYLKTHYPAAFLCARLADWGGFHHPAIYMAEAVRLGIPVRPPHVNYSDEAFTLHLLPPASSPAAATPSPEPSSPPNGHARRPVLYMGLGQVRDLRAAAVQAIVAQRRQRPFTGLRDLLARVPLHNKEITHLIECGALDDLGPSRASLLAEASVILAAGAQQLAFAFAAPAVAPETPAQRLSWEQHVLGQPITVHPLDLVRDRLGDVTPLRRLPEQPGRSVVTAGVRLPGWTGGQGFFLGDGDSFVVAIGGKEQPLPQRWLPVRVQGRWQKDEWGMAWLQVQRWTPLA